MSYIDELNRKMPLNKEQRFWAPGLESQRDEACAEVDALRAQLAQAHARAEKLEGELDAALASASESMKRDEMTIALLKSNLFDEGQNFSNLVKEYEELGDTLTVTREEREKAEAARELAEGENARLREAVLWALGENGDFAPRPRVGDTDTYAKGPYYWRTELRARAFAPTTPSRPPRAPSREPRVRDGSIFMNRPIGICSNCGGTVTVFDGAWGGTEPPVPTCETCGAVAAGPQTVIQMRRTGTGPLTVEELKERGITPQEGNVI